MICNSLGGPRERKRDPGAKALILGTIICEEHSISAKPIGVIEVVKELEGLAVVMI
jgi:hypothetical protein